MIVKAKSDTLKVPWSGRIVSIQPRIRLMRSFDERSHSYHGFVLRINGTCGDDIGVFLIAIGKATHAKHHFQAGMEASGQAVPVPDPRLESAKFYKASGLKILKDAEGTAPAGPPFYGEPPDLETYRSRGHRRLATRTYYANCTTCIWGCRMPVEIILDHWSPSKKQYRFEAFCYGPKSCPLYKPGPTRKVPGRRGMTWEEEDWVDEEATSHRGPDD
jgi:hypothetical protein